MAMTGILGTKLGMTQVFDETGQVVPVTVVQAGPCVVTAVRTPDNDGYSAVQIGFGEINPRKVTKPVAGLFEKAGVTPRRYVAEIRTEGASEYTLGQELDGRPVRGRPAGRRDRQVQGQGHRRRHEAARLQGPVRLSRYAAQAPLARLDRRAAPRRPASSRASGWPAGWAPSGRPCRA